MSQLRQHIRNFLVPATIEEIRQELLLSEERGDTERAKYVKEVLEEAIKEAEDENHRV